jgi:hypothetical protein
VPIASPQIVNQSVPITDNEQTSSDGHSCEHYASDEEGEQDEGGSAVFSSMIAQKDALIPLLLVGFCQKLKCWQ